MYNWHIYQALRVNIDAFAIVEGMSWTDEYREIVEFYYWEPQHIGRALNGKRFKSADEMYMHINRLEVSLNHVLNLFFSLFPLYKLGCFETNESHRMLTSWQLEMYARQQKNATQPDLFFVGQDNNIAIELKIASKSSLDQLVKYIQFNKVITEDTEKPLTLYFLMPHTQLTKVFKEKYATTEDIKRALLANELELPTIELLSYNELYKAFERVLLSGETEQRLVKGLLTYLATRADELEIII